MKKYVSIIINKSFLLGITIGIGLCLGLYLSQKSIRKSAHKFNQVLDYIERYYLEEIDKHKLENLAEIAIAKLAKQLDPHSTYLSAQQSAVYQAYLGGNFEGIGIEFVILKDTIYILNPIPQGPAYQAGIQAGDKIIKMDDQDWVGKELNRDKVVEKMRGLKGSVIKLSIQRGKEKQLLDINVIRDRVSTQSIEASYMVNDGIGYIKLIHFATNTHSEFIQKINQLREQGMQKLLLDLRNNSGGYLTSALSIAEEMIEPGKLLLYTEGRYKYFNKKYYANGKNSLHKVPIIILINENTASASELLAGTLQDHDRALIVGRRSFGKGLLQWPIEFKDKSVLNLTIERYFTPSGRFIQKPYDKRADYQFDLLSRYTKGEYFAADSIKFDPNLETKTAAGRKVYGGSGIMPDFFISLDTTAHGDYVNDLEDDYILQQYAIEYVQANKQRFEKMKLEVYLKSFSISESMVKELIARGTEAGIKHPPITNQIVDSIKHLLKAHIAKVLWQDQGFYSIYNQMDKTILQSLKLFNKAEELFQQNIDYVAERARKRINLKSYKNPS